MLAEESMKSLSDSRQMLSCDKGKKKKKAKQKWLPEHQPGFWTAGTESTLCCATLWEPDEHFSAGAAEKAVLRHVDETVMQRQHIVFPDPRGCTDSVKNRTVTFSFIPKLDLISFGEPPPHPPSHIDSRISLYK